MARSVLEQYTIADLYEFFRTKRLVLNPDFQRRSVWTDQAKSYLIDTILREMPIPKMYMRTVVDVETGKSLRDVVDGQQRLRAIFEFLENKVALGRRAREFAGLTYSRLTDDMKRAFLSYAIAVEQLIDAPDSEVLEVFSRLNSYNIKLNPAELRHAEFQGEFKWEVHEAAAEWRLLWEDIRLVSPRERLRMADDSFMSEMFGIVLQGVTDGGAPRLHRMYETYEKSPPDLADARAKVDQVLKYLTSDLREAVQGPLARAPHFLMLFAAAAHATQGIPKGNLRALPDRLPQQNPNVVKVRLSRLSELIEEDLPPADDDDRAFWRASHSSTQRIASRQIRFPVYYRALVD